MHRETASIRMAVADRSRVSGFSRAIPVCLLFPGASGPYINDALTFATRGGRSAPQSTRAQKDRSRYSRLQASISFSCSGMRLDEGTAWRRLDTQVTTRRNKSMSVRVSGKQMEVGE